MPTQTSQGTAARPGRGERLPSADRRKQILREAMQCFANLGFRGTTTRVLAERVGISEAALYRYFPSKESLYEAIIDQKMSVAPDLLDSLRPAVERRDDAAVFGGLARGIFERVDEDSAFLRIMMFTALEGHALAEPFFATRVRRLRDFITEYVAMRIAEGAFRDVHSGLAGRAFLGMVFDHLNVRYIFREGASRDHSLEDAADTFVSIFLGGIRTVVPTGEEPT